MYISLLTQYVLDVGNGDRYFNRFIIINAVGYVLGARNGDILLGLLAKIKVPFGCENWRDTQTALTLSI